MNREVLWAVVELAGLALVVVGATLTLGWTVGLVVTGLCLLVASWRAHR